MISTKDPLRTAFSHALLLPPKLPTEVWAWHAVVFEALRKLLEQLLQARTNESFDAMNGFPDAQRKLLEEVKNKWADVEQIHVTRANNTLENRLRELFESIDRPRLGEERLPLPSTPST
jgi:uncharacterized protein YicC (UPF0701 family)